MTIKSTGYLVTAQTVAWTTGQGIDSLINNEWTDLSDEIDNTSNLYTLSDLELVLGSAAYTGANSNIEIFIVRSLDGTNYPNWTGNVTTEEPENEQYFVDRFKTSQATEAQRVVKGEKSLPPGKFKIALRNKSGATFPASGNSLKYRPHSLQDV